MNKLKINKNENLNILKRFCYVFWFAPSDVFLRTADAILWRGIEFTHPILDIGCGDGRIDKLLFMNKSKIDIGLDNSKEEIKRAMKSKFYKKAVCSDAAKMPFVNETFSMVIANSTFEHIENDVLTIREVSRVLKRNGKFIFSVPTKRFYNILKKHTSDNNEFNNFNKRVSHLHYRTPADWKKILDKNGLIIKKQTFYFSKRALLLWYKLFKIATFKPYKRELWSYMKNSPYGKFFPKRIISNILFMFLKKYFLDGEMFRSKGCWVFIETIKK